MSDTMNDNQRSQLQKMLSANKVEDTTNLIRHYKNSHILRENVNNLVMLKAKYIDDEERVHLEGMVECSFLFTYYTDIYNKIRKDELELSKLFMAFDILQEVEDGKLDQNEGAFKFSTIMTKLYKDSALKKAEKLNEQTGNLEPEYKGPQVNVSWSQFKKMNSSKKR
jgi:hypothetical protein